MLPNLGALLAQRKQFVDRNAETTTGAGTNTADERSVLAALESRGGVARASAGVGFAAKSATGKVGLVNSGATCYLNSLVQALFMIPEFRRAVHAWPHEPAADGGAGDGGAQSVPRELQRLFARLQLSERAAVPTTELQRSFGWTGAEAFVQQDAQECWAVIFEHLAAACAGTALGRHLETAHRGELEDRLTCRACGGARGRKEPFRDLALAVRGARTLARAFALYGAEETLEGVECERCAARTPHAKALVLRALPDLLALQLRRFDFDWATMTRVKVDDELLFPRALDARGLASGRDERGGAAPRDDYELLAALMHTGSAHAGHYFAYIKVRAESTFYLLWQLALVSKVDPMCDDVPAAHGW